jgi:hypothetical protein
MTAWPWFSTRANAQRTLFIERDDFRALVAQRFITEEDGRYIMQEARYACVPGPANDPFAPRCWNDADGTVGGTVPATLSLT